MNIETLDNQLNQQILAGDILGAFDKFYAPNVVMQENSEPPVEGKQANREREVQFVNSVEQFHGAKVHAAAVKGDKSFSEWEMDITFKGGQRAKLAQTAVRTWSNDQVVSERFYYSKG